MYLCIYLFICLCGGIPLPLCCVLVQLWPLSCVLHAGELDHTVLAQRQVIGAGMGTSLTCMRIHHHPVFHSKTLLPLFSPFWNKTNFSSPCSSGPSDTTSPSTSGLSVCDPVPLLVAASFRLSVLQQTSILFFTSAESPCSSCWKSCHRSVILLKHLRGAKTGRKSSEAELAQAVLKGGKSSSPFFFQATRAFWRLFKGFPWTFSRLIFPYSHTCWLGRMTLIWYVFGISIFQMLLIIWRSLLLILVLWRPDPAKTVGVEKNTIWNK